MFEISERVVCEPVYAGVSLVALDSGSYYSLNRAGSLVWKCLENGMTKDRISALLSKAFGLDEREAKRDLSLFLGELCRDRLIVPSCRPGLCRVLSETAAP
jgi:hypothetical protein